jgi:hypothetical protein
MKSPRVHRLALLRAGNMRSARSAQYRAQIATQAHVRAHCEAVVREEVAAARMFNRRLVGELRAAQ